MTKLETLQDFAKTNRVEIYRDLPIEEGACSIQLHGRYAIAIPPDRVGCSADELVITAHELGHCMTGAFYHSDSPLSFCGITENRADKWAIRKLIPPDELQSAIQSGLTEPWELADHFEVSEPFMKKAMRYYKKGWIEK